MSTLTRLRRGDERDRGFTLIELLVVIIIVGILASIAVPVFLNQRAKAMNTRIRADIANVNKLVLASGLENGSYPSTGGLNVVYSSAGCPGSNPRADYVPGLGEALPQPPVTKAGNGIAGCYMYASDGKDYVLSAWSLVQGSTPNTGALYVRLGFREYGFYAGNGYLCNHPNIGGGGGYGPYSDTIDYYKWSFTTTSITTCDTTPPAGA